MKIIKTFIDNEYAVKHSLDLFKNKAFWIWGLGDDGNLYWKGSMSGIHSEKEWQSTDSFKVPMDFKTMKKLVEYFS